MLTDLEKEKKKKKKEKEKALIVCCVCILYDVYDYQMEKIIFTKEH